MNLLREPFVLLLTSLLVAGAVFMGHQPPAAQPAEVPDTEFSAVRAEAILQALYADGVPHPSGSAANHAVRDRLLNLLREYGYQPEVQRRFHCNAAVAACSPVENIVAVRQGNNPDQAILLTAHYDSSWAGPGVSDDGAGVAAIAEIARMASSRGAFEHDVIFLFTDAEEQGLIGADAFALHHKHFKRVRSVINLEARGSAGASAMFETGDGNRGIIRMLAKNLDRPVANSLAYEVYQRMPNDTDFSVYKPYGVAGVNFAFTDGAAIYHSRIDELQHLDRGSLQHHGQNAWALLLAMDERALEKLVSSEDAVYIDLFGHSLLHYPVSSAVGMTLVLSVLVMIAIRRTFSRQVVFRQMIWTLWGCIVLSIGLPAAGWLLSWPLGRWVDMHALQHPYPWLARATLLAAALWLIFRVLKMLAPRASTGSVMSTCWVLFALSALALAYSLPSASFIAVLPLLGFTLGLLLDGFRWKKHPRLSFAGLFGFLAAAYLGFYLFFMLDVVVNFDQSQYRILPLLFPAVAVLPLLVWFMDKREPGRAFDYLMGLVVIGGCVGQQFLPAYTSNVPRDMTPVYRQFVAQVADQADQAWLVLESRSGEIDRAFASEHGFTPQPIPRFDRPAEVQAARSVAALELPHVAWQLDQQANRAEGGTGQGQHRYQLQLQVPEGVQLLMLSFSGAADLRLAEVAGQRAWDANAAQQHQRNAQHVMINRPGSGLLNINFEVAGDAAFDLGLVSRYALPADVTASLERDWPANAQFAFMGPRALHYQQMRVQPR